MDAEARFNEIADDLVAQNDDVELGKMFGTEESSSFINGLLDRVAVALRKS